MELDRDLIKSVLIGLSIMLLVGISLWLMGVTGCE